MQHEDTEPPPPGEVGCYVYAVAAAGFSVPSDLIGIDGAAVRALTHGEVAAVVADVTVDRPPGRRAELMAHSEVVDAIAAMTTVVPVRFGSLMVDENSVVEDLLEPGHDAFVDQLEQLRDRAQFNLRASYRDDVALAEVVQASPEIADLRRRTRDLPHDEGYGERVRLGELVSRAMESKREFDAEVLLDAVLPFVAAHAVRGGGGLEHVLDVALLVDDERREDLEEQLEGLAESVHERIGLRLTGPMAPYDFVGGAV
jgi:gas vesicle protein GvpL/GvpF